VNTPRQTQPRRGGRKIAQDKRSAVLGYGPKINLQPRRGVAKALSFIKGTAKAGWVPQLSLLRPGKPRIHTVAVLLLLVKDRRPHHGLGSLRHGLGMVLLQQIYAQRQTHPGRNRLKAAAPLAGLTGKGFDQQRAAHHMHLQPLGLPVGGRNLDALQLKPSAAVEAAEQAKADSLRSVMRFADVLGGGATDQALPVTKALFRQVAQETEDLTDQAKARYQRPRPFTTNAALHPLLVTPSDGSRPTGQSPSYPSGHSAFAAVAGILLAAMVPEQRTAIFARAEAASASEMRPACW